MTSWTPHPRSDAALSPQVRKYAFAVSAALILFSVAIVAATALVGGLDRLTHLPPDDAFYYLSVARNFAEHGFWSFDGGISRASGMHWLFAYFLALLAHIPMSTDTTVAVVSAVSAALVLIGVATTLRVATRLFGLAGVVGVTYVACTSNFIQDIYAVMEWPFVIIISARLFRRVFDKADEPYALPLAFATGLLGSLARTEFGGVTAMIAAGLLLCWKFRPDTLRPNSLKAGLFALAGASVGFLMVMAHNDLIFGHPMSGSSMVKSYWASFAGYSLPIGLIKKMTGLQFLDEFLGVYGARYLIVAALVLFAVVVCRKDCGAVRRRMATPDHLPITLASALVLGFYTLLYVLVKDVRGWYTGVFAIPAMYLLAAVADGLAAAARWKRIAGAAMLGTLFAFNLAFVATMPWRPWIPARAGLADSEVAAKMFNSLHLKGRIGAWNAGRVGYYADQPVINLDGLVNDDVYPYIISGKLACYILKTDIQYVIDAKPFVFNPLIMKRYGYDSRLVSSLHEIATTPGSVWTIFKLDRDRLARLTDCGK